MILFIVLWVLWVVLNGTLTIETALFGVFFSGVLTLFSRKYLDYGNGDHHSPVYYLLLAGYLPILIWEILKANVDVIRLAFRRRLNFQPVLVYFKPELTRKSSLVILANSITITPGTITVILKDGQFCVHALDKSFAEGIDQSVLVKHLKKMEEV